MPYAVTNKEGRIISAPYSNPNIAQKALCHMSVARITVYSVQELSIRPMTPEEVIAHRQRIDCQ